MARERASPLLKNAPHCDYKPCTAPVCQGDPGFSWKGPDFAHTIQVETLLPLATISREAGFGLELVVAVAAMWGGGGATEEVLHNASFAEDPAVMEAKPSPLAESLPFVPEELARTLRHEIGDFLQKVYAVVAILQDRLPEGLNQERDLLAGLRRRAEQCRHLVDDVQDFLCPLHLEAQTFDLAALAAGLVQEVQGAYPRVQVQLEASPAAPVRADLLRITQVGNVLFSNACAAARHQVRTQVGVDPAAAQVVWTVSDDGPGVPADFIPRLFAPFRSTRPGHAGLGLALARKIVEGHSGQISAANLPEGGFRVKVVLPSA